MKGIYNFSEIYNFFKRIQNLNFEFVSSIATWELGKVFWMKDYSLLAWRFKDKGS